ncbi:MAG: GNAT family N-acetyltransferase, partial [Myxococcota bacterium]
SARGMDPGSPHLDSGRWRFVCTDPNADPEDTFRVAETQDGLIVGVGYRLDPPRHDGGRFRAVFVAVHPDSRRMGIGRALYQAVACEDDRDRSDGGWHLVTTIDERSDGALPFARAMGFKKSSVRLVMHRELPGRQLPEVDCEADIERFLGASAYHDWASIENAAFAGMEGTAPVTADELEDNRSEDFRPEHVRFARLDGKRVGVLSLRETSCSGFIETVAVLPEASGRSIGTALVASALDYLHERGHDSCELVVDKRNVVALKIYARLGFEEIARRSFLRKKPKAARR